MGYVPKEWFICSFILFSFYFSFLFIIVYLLYIQKLRNDKKFSSNFVLLGQSHLE